MSWLREPHRALFPLGALLAALGVLPWILFALGLESIYQPIFFAIGFRALFHPLIEVQASMTCFAAGFLMTSLSRAGSARVLPWQLGIALVAPLAIAVAAALDRWALAQLAWGLEAAMLIGFAQRRSRRPVPAATLAWLPAGLALGAAGALLGWLGETKAELSWLYDPGRALVLQGLLAPLVLASAGHVPGAFDLQPAPAQPAAPRRPLAVALHALLALLFAGSFVLEPRWPRPAYALRALVTLLALVGPLRLAETAPGPRLQRKLAQMALLFLPVGFAVVAADPLWRRIGLHVVYLGSFGSLAFALVVGALPPHHPRAPAAELHGRLDRLMVALVLLAMSLVARVLLEADPLNFRFWLGTASICFAVLGAVWWSLVAKREKKETF